MVEKWSGMTAESNETLIGFISFLSASVSLFAHHGTGVSYHMDKRVTLKGVATEFRMANPHCQLYFDVTDESGKAVK